MPLPPITAATGNSLTFEQVYETQGGDREFKVTFSIVNPEIWNEFLNINTDFFREFKVFFKQVVFEAHRYLLRVTPIQTGMLRGGWLGILNKYQQDYMAAFIDMSLLNVGANTGKPLDMSAVAKGLSESQWLDSDLDVTLINSVPYAEYVEFGTSKMEGQHFTQRAMYKTEFIMAQAMDDWFKEITIKGRIVPPPKPEEVTA